MSSQQLGMPAPAHTSAPENRVLIIGAGIGGLAAAARLAHAGMDVCLFESHSGPGGKLRALPTPAGPVDAGPTVLTLRTVFDTLYADIGARLDDHLTLTRQHILARHFWPDGSRLDLFDSEEASADAIHSFAGSRAAQQFRAFTAHARQLFEAFDAPMMRAADPSPVALAATVARRPRLLRTLAPFASLDGLLRRAFDDPRLVQLFGRYATYVGGSPYLSPALLALIWQAEAAGVWVIEEGMHQLAKSLAGLAEQRGATLTYNAKVAQIDVRGGSVAGITLTDGSHVPGQRVLFNGDPHALTTGLLGQDCARAAPATKRSPRSLSAEVWAFAARATGPKLAHHNVFFRDDPKPEFDALSRGELTETPTLYVCDMDAGRPVSDPHRFETIANAPPLGAKSPHEDITQCQTRTFQTLAGFGLRFDRAPGQESLTTPTQFNRLFPGSTGSLYGQSPHGLMAGLQRPRARTPIRGLYLAGGGTHPGAGLPMATLSGQHAAAAILNDRTSRSMSARTAMPGGISTASAPLAGAPSASSGS